MFIFLLSFLIANQILLLNFETFLQSKKILWISERKSFVFVWLQGYVCINTDSKDCISLYFCEN